MAIFNLFLVILVLQVINPFKKMPYWPVKNDYAVAAHSIHRYGAADISIIGSSRSRDGIILPVVKEILTEQLRGSFRVENYSSSGARLNECKLFVERLLREEKKPSLILVGVSPLSFFTEPTGSGQALRFMDVRDWGYSLGKDGGRSLKYFARCVQNEAKKHIAIVLARDAIPAAILSYKNFGEIRYGPYDSELPTFHILYKDNSIVGKPIPESVEELLQGISKNIGSVNNDEVRNLTEIIGLCNKANVSLVFFELPYSSALSNIVSSSRQREFHEIIGGLVSGTRADFVSIDKLDIEFPDEDFRDYSHLNLTGSKKLSEAVAYKIIIPKKLQSKAPIL